MIYFYWYCKFVRVLSSVGIVPTNLLVSKYLFKIYLETKVIWKKKKRVVEIFYSCCNFVKLPNSVAMVPSNWLVDKDLFWRY